MFYQIVDWDTCRLIINDVDTKNVSDNNRLKTLQNYLDRK